MERILQVVPNMQLGGLETFIMNVYRNIDKSKIQFDFLVHYEEEKHYDKEIIKLGGKIYRFSLREDNKILKYIIQLDNFFKEHKEYKVIHCHMSSIGFVFFAVAKKNGVKIRIAHSHNSQTDKTLKGRLKRLMMLPYKYISTHNWACATEAGKFLYGNKQFEVIPNAIDIKKFKFDQNIRNRLREELGFDNNDIVLGHIGRFNIQKNHDFLIDLMSKLKHKNNKFKLVLIGDGELKNEIKNKVIKKSLEKNIIFLGTKSNVCDYYNVMDMFLLPSLFEGLPVVGIEAQANGIKCLFSDVITKEVVLSDCIELLPLNIDIWLEKIVNNVKSYDRYAKNDKLLNSCFNIHKLAKDMECRYLRLSDEGGTNEDWN